ncbi:peptide-methionine (S)-S-oxide reductase MsrA [Veronia pacifica]|uniref:Peptide methionine sulfoxide reductase MsrA n=1 Tax=Veronia pacifica TaxID=1080227 RepID=A0A1C3EQ10_9GAMM|nr:peptide-methionine (S)-S-oxide reductase MsrA [Veronia pacifica]ODA35306.1 peptide-methionine (S)-S-oxide reductase [Veronia pacifica]
MFNKKQQSITSETALPDRLKEIIPSQPHAVNNIPLVKEAPEGLEQILVAMGCFWGAERLFWNLDGVKNTSVGYSAGYTVNPSYDDVCSGKTGHAEVVQVIYDPNRIRVEELMATFWQSHDPTQGMRQGNDIGTQYRSGVYWFTESQKEAVEASKVAYQQALADAGKHLDITTEIRPAGSYYFAETYHQQYLHKNPNGYCGLGGTGVCFPPE